jgi:NAD-dependent DNA ligase
MSKSKKIKELRDLIKYYDASYYGMNRSLISDFEYDKLKKEYKDLGGKDFIGYEQEFSLVAQSIENSSRTEKKTHRNFSKKISSNAGIVSK